MDPSTALAKDLRKSERQQTFYAAYAYTLKNEEWSRYDVKVFDQSERGLRLRSMVNLDGDKLYLQLDSTNSVLALCDIRRSQPVARNCWEFGVELTELAEMHEVLPEAVRAAFASAGCRLPRDSTATAPVQAAKTKTSQPPTQQRPPATVELDQFLNETLGLSALPTSAKADATPAPQEPKPAAPRQAKLKQTPVSGAKPVQEATPQAAAAKPEGLAAAVPTRVAKAQAYRQAAVTVPTTPTAAPVPTAAPTPAAPVPVVAATAPIAPPPVVTEAPTADVPSDVPTVTSAAVPTAEAPSVPAPASSADTATKQDSVTNHQQPAPAPPVLNVPRKPGFLKTLTVGAAGLASLAATCVATGFSAVRSGLGSMRPGGRKTEEETRLEWLQVCAASVKPVDRTSKLQWESNKK